jgi:hypothetical protein
VLHPSVPESTPFPSSKWPAFILWCGSQVSAVPCWSYPPNEESCLPWLIPQVLRGQQGRPGLSIDGLLRPGKLMEEYQQDANLEAPFLVYERGGNQGPITGVASFSRPYGLPPCLATASREGGIDVVDSTTGEAIATLSEGGHQSEVLCLASYEAGVEGLPRLVAGNGAGAVVVWGQGEGDHQPSRVLRSHGGAVRRLHVYHEAGRGEARVVAGDETGGVR